MTLPPGTNTSGEPYSAAMTRFLRQKMLEVCQDYVSFSHQVNILGVITLTVDDEPEDLVVKFQHIFKRTNQNSVKEGAPQKSTRVVSSTGGQSVPRPVALQQHQQQSPSVKKSSAPALNNGSEPTVNGVANGYAHDNSERKSHGRKRAHPVKVHQVFDEDLGSDEEEPITVIPEAPESTLSMSSSPASEVPLTNKSRLMSDVRASGSAKRKPTQQFRVPQYASTPSKNPYMRQALSEVGPFCTEPGESENTINSGVHSLSTNSPSQGLSGLTLPVYVPSSQQNGAINPIEIAPEGTDSEREDPSRSPSKSPGDLYIDEENSSTKVKDENSESILNSTFSSPLGGDAPLDFSRSGLQTMAGLYGLTSTSFAESPSVNSQLPFSALNLLSSMRRSDPVSDGDGLSIKYTSTGPYTVGANGKDVSNSSRIKDIIMYDEHSPFNAQKGMKMEQDYIVDRLGMDGRKRRRRAPEDQLTPEEIAEYLGTQKETQSEFSFKCKYCNDLFDSVTKYIHHTLAAHSAYICHQCGKSFTTKSSLLRHRPIHTGMRRYGCKICGKKFYRKDKTKAHVKRHFGGGSGDANQAAENAGIASLADSACLADNISSIGLEHDSAENSNAMNQFPTNLDMATAELE